MAGTTRLSVSELVDDDLFRLFGQYYWYPGAAAMREQLAAAELYGYRRGRLWEGVVGLTTEGDQTFLVPWTPAVAGDAQDGDAVALALLEAAKAGRGSLLSIMRDTEGSRAPIQARWLRCAGFGEVTVRLVMARDCDGLPIIPDREGQTWESVANPEDLAQIAEAAYTASADPLAAARGTQGWSERLRQLKQGELGTYRPELSGLLRAEGRLVGFFLGTGRGPGSRFPEGWAYLADIGVIPEARRQRRGTALLARFLTCCRQNGYGGVWLLVDEMNAPARGMYQAHGFRVLELLVRGRWLSGCRERRDVARCWS